MEKISHYLFLKCVSTDTSRIIGAQNAIMRVGGEEEIYRFIGKDAYISDPNVFSSIHCR